MVLQTREGLLLVMLIFYAFTFTLLGMIPIDYFQDGTTPSSNLYRSGESNEEAKVVYANAWDLAKENINPLNPINDLASLTSDAVYEETKKNDGFFSTVIVNLENAPTWLNIILFTPFFVVTMYILLSFLPFLGK